MEWYGGARVAGAAGSAARRRRSGLQRVEREIQLEHVHPRLAEEAELPALGVLGDERAHLSPGRAPRAFATRATWYSAAAGLMCGSSPLPEAVTRSTGTGAVLSGSASRSASTRALTASASAGLSGPWLEPRRRAGVVAASAPVAEARPQKYFGSPKGCPIRRGADHLAVALDQAAVRLPREDRLRDAGHDQRIDDAGDDRQDARASASAGR